MPYISTPDPVIRAVQQMHPNPFVQSAILRVYANAPGLLAEDAVVTLQAAYDEPTTTTTDPKGA